MTRPAAALPAPVLPAPAVPAVTRRSVAGAPTVRDARRWAGGTALAALLLAGCGLGPGPALAQGDRATAAAADHEYRVVTVQDGLENPWALAFLPDGALLVTERPGRLRLIEDGRLRDRPIRGTPTVANIGQGGLLDIALHPRFAETGLIYLSYAKPGPRGATTAVARGRLDRTALALVDVEDIFVADAWDRGGRHFGSRLLFDRDGYLYVTIGDRGDMDRAQDRSDHAGATVRLHEDGSVPADNPFVGQDGVRPELYTYGNRNAQGMALHPETGAVWQNEHGPRGGDEINLIRAGRNYGWPVVTHGRAYTGGSIGIGGDAEGMEPPLVDWTPSIAPSGMAFYTGDRFPAWQGSSFTGALAGQHLARVRFDGLEPVEEERLLDGFGARIRDVRDGPDGALYLLIDHGNGALLRLEPADG